MSKNTPDFNDPITLQVMWNRLIFIADQADNVLGRTAFSPIVRENHDYVTVLLDSRGRALAQCTWSIPVFITSLPIAAQNYFLPKFPAETLEQGDVLATNDPEIGTGHLPDVTMITPIFKKGKVVAYAGSIAHLPDIGGRPLHSEASDIFEEGIRFPILKLHKAGEPNQDVLDIIAASVRLPTEVLGDLEVDGRGEQCHGARTPEIPRRIRARRDRRSRRRHPFALRGADPQGDPAMAERHLHGRGDCSTATTPT